MEKTGLGLAQDQRMCAKNLRPVTTSVVLLVFPLPTCFFQFATGDQPLLWILRVLYIPASKRAFSVMALLQYH